MSASGAATRRHGWESNALIDARPRPGYQENCSRTQGLFHNPARQRTRRTDAARPSLPVSLRRTRMLRPLSYRPQLEVLEDRTVPTAVAPPSGILSWWAGDDNATDLVGPNNGTLNKGVSFVQGEVADAFSFNG